MGSRLKLSHLDDDDDDDNVTHKIGWDGMDWIDLIQNREQWRAVVNTVMNLRVP
jgi:hypothetical protein